MKGMKYLNMYLAQACACMIVCVSPSGEDAVFQAGGLAAEPSALVTGRTAAGQGGARRREGSDQQAAERSYRDGETDWRWRRRRRWMEKLREQE